MRRICMKQLPPKERPDWCPLRPLTWDEVLQSEELPLWFEIKGSEHLNQWCLVDIDAFTGKVSIITRKGTYDIKEKYSTDFLVFSPLPKK